MPFCFHGQLTTTISVQCVLNLFMSSILCRVHLTISTYYTDLPALVHITAINNSAFLVISDGPDFFPVKSCYVVLCFT